VPTVSRFYGITIQMFFKEHGTAHFHARYGGEIAVYTIEPLDVVRGQLASARTVWSASGQSCIEPS
jgi:hypothetical protein